jgi:acyl-ACP thioesterase
VQPEAFTEMVGPPPGGRVFKQMVRPGLADCAPSGRIRLDAVARWLQDVAYADVEEVGVARSAIWVVRRARIQVERFPRFGESFTVATYCSGLGRMWAERRTRIVPEGDGGDADVEAVALWVHLDPIAQRPSRLTQEELTAYGDAAAGRRVSARLRHRSPEAVQGSFPWIFRATECDLAGHINNTAYWQPLEEELLSRGDPERIDVEIEYRTPCQPGEKMVLCDGYRRWIVGEEGDTHASIVVAGGPASTGARHI